MALKTATDKTTRTTFIRTHLTPLPQSPRSSFNMLHTTPGSNSPSRTHLAGMCPIVYHTITELQYRMLRPVRTQVRPTNRGHRSRPCARCSRKVYGRPSWRLGAVTNRLGCNCPSLASSFQFIRLLYAAHVASSIACGQIQHTQIVLHPSSGLKTKMPADMTVCTCYDRQLVDNEYASEQASASPRQSTRIQRKHGTPGPSSAVKPIAQQRRKDTNE